MREALQRWVCVAVGLSIGLAGGAHASEYTASIVPARTPPASAIKPLSARPSQHAVRLPVTILAMTPQPDPGAQTRAPTYDLRVARAYASSPLATIKQTLRARGTGMRDAYLHGNSGLRASIGSSYHMQYRAADSGPAAAAGSAALMRLPLGAVNLRDGYEGYAPVAMAGYDVALDDRTKIGVEGGMMVGRSTAMYADETVPHLHEDGRASHNPVADLVMTYDF